jgi:hypothetical protein
VSDGEHNPALPGLAALIEEHGAESVLSAAGTLLRREADAYEKRARDERQDPRDIRLVAGLVRAAADKASDASLDYYASTK